MEELQLNLDVSTGELEKKTDADSSNSLPVEDAIENQHIVWHYLTFETELPRPASSETRHGEPLPECPDLKKYTSPFLWSEGRKKVMVWLSVVATMFTAYQAGSYTSGVDQMQHEWHISRVAALLGLTLFTCGFGIAPMFLAPFSEINGRRPVFVVTGLLWFVFQIVCAVTPTFAGMLVSRFLAGCFSSTFSTMVGGVIADIYHAKNRNTAMTLFAGGALTGTGLGPMISGPIAQHLNWRWIFYVQLIMDGVLMIFVVFLFAETRGSILLSKKANVLNRYYDQLEAAGCYGHMMPSSTGDTSKEAPQRLRWKCKDDEERTSLSIMIKISLWRPFYMLFTEPVVFFFSLWVSFSWAVLYMCFSAIPLVYAKTYDFNVQQSGLIFAASSIGSIIFTVVCVYQEKLGLRYLPSRQRAILYTPEGRLYFACVESVLLPIGVLWFCISGSYPSVPWVVPALGIAAATMGVFSVYLAVFNYLADSYHRWASSALAAQSFCRNLLAGAFPL